MLFLVCCCIKLTILQNRGHLKLEWKWLFFDDQSKAPTLSSSIHFGFRQKCLLITNHVLIQITESIRHSIDNNEFGCGTYIDLKKAIDTVNRFILFFKTESLRSER